MTYYAEWSKDPIHGVPPQLYDIDTLVNKRGFTTAYAFNEEVCEWIFQQWNEKHSCYGTFRGLAAARLPVWTDLLLADFDNDPESAWKFVKYLESLKVSHTVWDSGGGATVGINTEKLHVHVECVPQEDWRIPHSQLTFMQQWAKAHNASFDSSVYRPASLFRLPGTPHKKTGRRKSQLTDFQGRLLDYDLVSPSSGPLLEPSTRQEVLACAWRLLLSPVIPGGRRLHVWKITSQLSRLGWGEEEIMEHLKYWNASLKEKQLTVDELADKMYVSL